MSGALPIIDARRIPNGSTIGYDVCIVGSGAAGATAALGLAGRGLRIVVVESGGAAPDAATAELTDLDSTLDEIAADSRRRWLGGTTNAWTGGKSTLDDVDLAVRPWVPESGWPLDPARLRSCYERAARLFEWPGPGTYDEPSVDSGDGFLIDSDGLRTVVFNVDARPVRFGDALRRRLTTRDGVDVFTLANVTEVMLDAGGAAVEGVDVATVTGTRFRIAAPTVLLACGAIENARLLLASRSRRTAGLGNANDLVGRYFQDHPKGYTGTISPAPGLTRLPDSHYWGKRPSSSGGYERWGVALSAEAQESAGVLNSYVRLEPEVLGSLPPGIETLKRVARGRVRGIDPTHLATLPQDHDQLLRLARFRLRNRGPIHRIKVRSFLEQEPRHDSRVRLGERLDRFGAPLAAVDWSLSELDRRSVRVLHAALAGAVVRLGIGELDAPLDDDAPAWSEMADASHHAGTTRMGTDPNRSVTGPGGQVHDVGGLFIAGASLFPTSGYANPVFTITATTLHVVDHVVGHIRPAPVEVAEPTPAGRDALRPTPAGRDEVRRWISTRRRARSALPAASRGLGVVWAEPGSVALTPTEVRAPGPGQVTVLVDVTAVSPGTERARWLGLPGASVQFPHRPGYSASGVIRSCGPGVYDLEPGARVATWVAPHQSLVTVDRLAVEATPEGRDPAEAALVGLGTVGALGTARAGPIGGRSVAVIGAGPIGLLTQRLAAAEGAASCTVIAASDAKDDVARGDGSVSIVRPTDVDAVGADVVIEATGVGAGLDLALRAARPGATVVLLGTTRAEEVELALDLVEMRSLRLVGAHGRLLDRPGGVDGIDRRAAARLFLDRWATGALTVSDMISERYDPRDIGGLYERMASDRALLVPVLEWWRLPDGLRMTEGRQTLPNPTRTTLHTGWRPRDPGATGSPVTEHPPAGGRPAVAGEANAGALRATAVVEALGEIGPERGVRIVGSGPAALHLMPLLAGRSTAGTGERAAVVVDTAPTTESIRMALEAIDDGGMLIISGPARPIDIDVQGLLHRKGVTLVGAGPSTG